MTDNIEEPVLTIAPRGNKFWKNSNGYHRLDGPAIEFVDGHKEWCFNNKPHRLDGPAVENTDGSVEWWIHGRPFASEYEFIKFKQLSFLEE